jgi:hypothetical protein
MDLLRLLGEMIFDWLRQLAVELSSRYAGELVCKRLRRKSERSGKHKQKHLSPKRSKLARRADPTA